MASAIGKFNPGKWWSVIKTLIPASFAAKTPLILDIPLSTVISRSGLNLLANVTISGVRP